MPTLPSSSAAPRRLSVASLFHAPRGRAERCLFALLSAALFLLGALAWASFLEFGAFSMKIYDWRDKCRMLEAIQLGFRAGLWPFYYSPGWRGVDRLFALPNAIVSPQVALLKFMGPGAFMLWHTLLLYACGCWGCLLLARRWRFSFACLALFFLLFNFNGHIAGHLAAGHTEWHACFLLPLVAHHLLALRTRPRESCRRALWLAGLLALMLFQGGVHIAALTAMLLGLLLALAIWRGCISAASRRWQPALALAVALLPPLPLAAARLLPALTVMRQLDSGPWHVFIDGFYSPAHLWRGLVTLSTQQAMFDWMRLHHRGAGAITYGWEYNYYVGPAGLAFLALFGLAARFTPLRCWRSLRFKSFDAPLLLFFIFSFGALYKPLFDSPLPLLGSVERVPSRFFIIPLLFLSIFACIRLQALLDSIGGRPALRRWLQVAVALALAALAFTLWRNFSLWRPCQFAPIFRNASVDLSVSLKSAADPLYENLFRAGCVVSAAAFALWAAALWRLRRPPVPGPPPTPPRA